MRRVTVESGKDSRLSNFDLIQSERFHTPVIG